MDSLDFYIFYCNSDITRPLLLQRFHWWQGPLELYNFAFCPRHIYSYLWKSPRDTPPMGHSPPVLRPTCSSPAVSLSWYPACEVHVMALPEEGCHPAQHTQSPSLENEQCPKEIQPTEIQFCLPTPATWQFLVLWFFLFIEKVEKGELHKIPLRFYCGKEHILPVLISDLFMFSLFLF